MISNSLGAMPRQTARNLAEYAETWATRGVRGWEERWWEMPLEVGDKIARIIGAPPAPSACTRTSRPRTWSRCRACGRRARASGSSARRWTFRRWSICFARSRRPASSCASCRPRPTSTVRTERMLDAIDETTAVVAFSHVLFRTSYIMDADGDRRAARTRSARPSILDTYQSAGIIPVDVAALGVDFAVGGCLKWLCGGPGNAFLYTRPDLLARASRRSPAGCRTSTRSTSTSRRRRTRARATRCA